MIYFKKKSWIKKSINKVIEKTRETKFPVFSLVRNFLISFIILLGILYPSYLFLVPKYANSENVQKLINTYLLEDSKLTLDTKNLKIKPNYKFAINLNADYIKLIYPNKTNFISIEKPNIEINLLSLLQKNIDLNKVETKKITISTNFTKEKKYDCFKYFNFSSKQENKFKLRNINLISDNFNFNLYDENIKKNFYINSNNLKINSSEFKKSIIITTTGTLSSSTQKISDFNLNLSIKTNKDKIGKFKDKIANLNYNPFLHPDKYHFYSNTNIDLKINPTTKYPLITGNVTLKNYSFLNLPKNNLILIFKDGKITTDADFKFMDNQNIKIKSSATISKNKFIEAKLTSSEINLADFKKILDVTNKIFHIKLNIDNIELNGLANADIYLKSNFKTINSNGKLLIKDAKIHHKTSNLIVENINSNINFANDTINIINANGFIDNKKINLTGTIDKNANLNLKINSDKFRHEKLQIKIDSTIKGTLENPTINTNLLVDDTNIAINGLINNGKFTINKGLISNSIFITGAIEKDNFKNIKISIPNKTTFKGYNLKGEINLSGKITKPEIIGKLNIYDFTYKSYNINIPDITLNINNQNFYINIPKGQIFDLDFDLIAQGIYNKDLLLIESANFNSMYVNLNSFEKFLKTTQKNNNFKYEIKNLKGNIATLESTDILLNSLNFIGSIKNNILTIDKFSAEALGGMIEGLATTNLENQKTNTKLTLKEINVRLLSKQLKDISIAASGRLNALITADFIGFNYDNITNTIDGNIKFDIKNGELNHFAKLERFLQAGNILSQSILKLSLNSTLSALTKQNTGDFKVIEGIVELKRNKAQIEYIKTQGSNMSMYITGEFNLLSSYMDAKILGRIPNSFVNFMGNIGKFSLSQKVNKMDSETKETIEALTASPVEKALSEKLDENDILKIPPLAYHDSTIPTREFIVFIDGNIKNLSSVKKFKWNTNKL